MLSYIQPPVLYSVAGFSVITVNASDEDVGENGRLRYSLQGSLGDFSINPQSGLITVSNKLDSVRELYRLIVSQLDVFWANTI